MGKSVEIVFLLTEGQNAVLPARPMLRVTFHSVCMPHGEYFGLQEEMLFFFCLKIDYAFVVCMLV